MPKKTVRFGIIGCGLMGREFASASARWCHLLDAPVRPEIVAICNRSKEPLDWFTSNFPSIEQVTHDYRELLSNDQIDALYVAVPHHLHEEIYCAVIRAGKHLMGEKPFGIDKEANDEILKCLAEHPEVFARCCSQFPFFPAVQRIGEMIEASAFGRIIEVNAAFLHSSDLDPLKPINWKRKVDLNGHYGCLGDLGMHICHVPFRAGWVTRNVRAILSNIIQQRPDHTGTMVPCDTWDNATLFCDALDPTSGVAFPLTFKTERIAPGEKNTWRIEVLGTQASARFSTKNPKRLELLETTNGRQDWRQIETGQETTFPNVTGGIFEFGFSDAILQMWAAFSYELEHGQPLKKFASCVTPEETALSHRLFTSALQSHDRSVVVTV